MFASIKSLLSGLSRNARRREERAAVRQGRVRLGNAELRLEALEERAVFAVGDIDPGFAAAGVAASTDYTWNASAVQGDGKIVVVGSFDTGVTKDAAVMRLNVDGSIDTTFGGGDGIVTFDVGTLIGGSASGDVATDVAIDANGNIVLGGTQTTALNASSAFVARLDGAGALDTNFSTDGVATFSLGNAVSNVEALAIDSAGRILVAGSTVGATVDGAIARLTTAGVLDTSFSTDGLVGFDAAAGLSEVFSSIAVRANDTIVAVGTIGAGAAADVLAVGFDAAGAIDATFGTAGSTIVNVATGAADFANDAVFDSAGRLVIAGSTLLGAVQDMTAIRLNANGTVDASFGDGDGVVTVDLDGAADAATSVTVDALNNIVLAGSAGTSSIGVVRLLASTGLLDLTFNSDGKAILDLGNLSTASSVALTSAGNVIVTANGMVNGNLGTNAVGSVIRLLNPAFSLAVDGSINGSADVDVNEGSVAGAAVANLSGVGFAQGANLTYSLTSNPGGLFTIVDNQLRVNGPINFEAGATQTVTVQVSDGVNVATQDITIDVNNLAPSVPVDSDVTLNSVAVGAIAGTVVGVTGLATDAAGGTVTYSLTNDANGRFVINPTTGVVSVASGAVINAADVSYNITVQASDGTTSSSGNFTINVGNAVQTNVVLTAPDLLNPAVTSLYIYGTTAADKIDVTVSRGVYIVKLNGVRTTYTLSADARVYVYGNAGNDRIALTSKVVNTAYIEGGDGDDKITGGRASDIILGGLGNDTIKGGAGRDIVIGGLGIDRLYATGWGSARANEGNIMIGDSTTLDADLAALAAIQTAWIANDVTTDAIVGAALNASTVIGDGVQDRIQATIKAPDQIFSFELSGGVQLDRLVYFRSSDFLN